MKLKSEEMYKEVIEAIKSTRVKKPLIECLTNTVTINDCANIILASGSSPIMAEDKREVEEVVSFSSALLINIGTLQKESVEAMLKAGKKANEIGIPVIFDPVGVGATTLRNEASKQIISEIKLAVIRGNMSEIRALSGFTASTKGVDVGDCDIVNKDNLEHSVSIVQNLAKNLNCVVAATGAIDIVASQNGAYIIENGHSMLADITGTGCMCSAVVAAFCGGSDNYCATTIAGIISMGIAGEKAYEFVAKGDCGIGTFRVKMMDYIYTLSEKDILEMGKIYEA